ncbi:MAG: FadD3 family acyl-CoA ligase [Myxococcota bacterium]|nr:FadD3 family acyl-CoA ligase [Myxococcota bacterium]
MQVETIPALVQQNAERFGDAPAIEDGDFRLTHRELAAACLDATRGFIAAGIEPGERVGIWAPNLAEWILAAVGLQGAGACLVTLSTRLKGTEAAYTLRKSRARMLLTVNDFLGVDYVDLVENQDLPDLRRIVCLAGARERDENWNDFVARGESVSPEDARARIDSVHGDDLADLIFTSGTTGNPKAVMSTHAQDLRVFSVFTDVIDLRETDRYLVVNPFFHSFGYKGGWLSCLITGATILPHAVFDVDAVLERISTDRISVMPGPPTLFQSLLAHPKLADYDLSHLRMCTTGAAPTPVELIHRMREELGFESIINAYGLSETTGVVSLCRPDDDDETVATTCGRAIPDIEVRCVDRDGKEVPRGEPGEVIVRGYNVMKGYFDDAEETAKAIDSDGWLHTGDIAVMNERGYLRITDRIKDMYILGGFNCYPAEIESLLFGSGLCAQVAVIGIPDERQGEVGMAFVVPAPGAEVSQERVIAWSRENMANYKVPRRVEIVEELPTNATGKVLKYVLRERAAANT